MQAEEREGWDRLVAASREECVHRSRGESCYLELTDVGTAVILAAADELARLKAIAEAARAYREADVALDKARGKFSLQMILQKRQAEAALFAALDGESRKS